MYVPTTAAQWSAVQEAGVIYGSKSPATTGMSAIGNCSWVLDKASLLVVQSVGESPLDWMFGCEALAH